jgi:D-ribose pyranase
MNGRSTVLNPALAGAIAALGHTQTLWIVDPGLPLPFGPTVIDLSLSPGVPSFAATFEVIMSELVVESACLASEARTTAPALVELVASRIGPDLITYVSHHDFKLMSADARTIVRTGEMTPYANVCLSGGVSFG